MKFKKYFILSFSITLLAISCSKQSEDVAIKGEISNANGKVIYLSKLGSEGIESVDSLTLKKSGKFRFSLDRQAFPEFYFIKVDNSGSITLLIDSLKQIEVMSEYPDLLQNATIKAGEENEMILESDKKLFQLRKEYAKYKMEWDTFSEEERKTTVDILLAKVKDYKAYVGDLIMKNPRSFVGYYWLNQRLDSENMMFTPYDEDDFKYFGTLATSLNIFYPEAPRTKAFYAKVQDAVLVKRQAKLREMIQEASDELPDIGLPNLNGDTIKLSSKRGKVVVLNYWMSENRTARLFNRELRKIYYSYRKRGLDVYQISLDKSKILWEVALEEDQVDWTSVCDFKGGASKAVWMFNIKELPTTFLINRKGELVGKYNDPVELEKKITELL